MRARSVKVKLVNAPGVITWQPGRVHPEQSALSVASSWVTPSQRRLRPNESTSLTSSTVTSAVADGARRLDRVMPRLSSGGTMSADRMLMGSGRCGAWRACASTVTSASASAPVVSRYGFQRIADVPCGVMALDRYAGTGLHGTTHGAQ